MLTTTRAACLALAHARTYIHAHAQMRTCSEQRGPRVSLFSTHARTYHVSGRDSLDAKSCEISMKKREKVYQCENQYENVKTSMKKQENEYPLSLNHPTP